MPINNLANRFKTPLEKSGIDVSALEDEWIDLLDYSQKYLNTATFNHYDQFVFAACCLLQLGCITC